MWNRARLVVAFVLAAAAPAAAQNQSRLESAYRQELKLLQAEKEGLLARIRVLERQSGEDAARLRKEVGEIAEQVTTLRLENEALEQKLGREEEGIEVGGDREALLGNVLDQATSTLLRHGIKIEDEGQDPGALIGRLFAEGCDLAERLGKLRVEEGSYFAADGSERKAEILRISRVAAYSLDPASGGALGPAVGDSLKVLYPEPLGRVRDLVEGRSPSLVGMYLFDPLEKESAQAQAGQSLWETFQAGGFVMWPILFLAVVAVMILMERLFVLRRVHTNAGRLMQKVGDHISRGHWGKAAGACREEPGAVARVLGTILRYREQPRSLLEELVNEAILAERPTLERFLPALNVIAAVAPLLGLLGTVTGMIGTFYVITEHGTGDPRLLSGGISEALLTTQFGLIVAIPTLLVHSLLSGRVEHVLSDMETNALRLLNKMHCEHCELLKDGACRGAWNGEAECPNLVKTASRPPPEEKPVGREGESPGESHA